MIDKRNLFYIFLLMQPFIDLITGITTKLELSFLSVGIIIRGIFILLMLIYLFFFCHSKYKRKSCFYVGLICLYTIIYFLTKTELLTNTSFLINDTIYLFKYLYFLILFITLLNYYFENKLDYKKIVNILLIDLSFYLLFIIVPFLTNTSFSSYAAGKGSGVVGWFYAANDISIIIVLLFSLILLKINERVKWYYVLLLMFGVITCLLIGTKTAYFGILLTFILGILYYLFYLKKKWKQIILLIIFLVCTIFLGLNSSVVDNIKTRVDKYEEYQETGTNKEDENDIVVHKNDTASSIVILSSRDRLLRDTYDIYKTRNISEKLFGIGFSNRLSIDNEKIEKLVEIDFFDVLFHGGIVLVILYLVPYVFVGVYFIRYVIKNKLKIELWGWILGYLVMLGLGISFISGHVFSSPSVLIYYTIIVIMFLEYFNTGRTLKRKKISFLLLHLGNGGIEQATVNLSNALARNYDVELVVAYKSNTTYNINQNIKINYLIGNDIAFRISKYKELFKRKEIGKLLNEVKNDYLKKGKIFTLFHDINDSIRVLILRKEAMIKYIKNSDSDIIISTRVEYSKLLSEYGSSKTKKIAVEHRHHNNDKKYIKMIKNDYQNIDYLVCLTDGLKKDFEKFLKNNKKTKVVTIPNMITNYPKHRAKLKNKNIISISRIVPGKRIDEIVEVASVLKQYNFTIIGDGDDYEKINKIVKNKGLSNVELLGNMENKNAMKELEKASIFIMTSVTEGLPMVLLEAFSYGVPVVAYQTDSGVSDIVDNGINGYVIQNRNQKEMISKIKELMNDYDKRKHFGEKAYRKSLKYSEKEIVKKWYEIL